MKHLLVAACMACLCVAAVVAFVGCENKDSVANADFYIDPPNAVATVSNSTVALSAVGGHEPYAWAVSDATLGQVTGGGTDVTYTRTGGNGVNTVTVTDGLGWTASASISQQDDSTTPAFVDPTLTPSTASLTSDGDKVTFQAAGGDLPYSWGVGDDARGHISPSGRDQAVYTRDASGNNTVILTDSQGRVFIAQITQPSASGSMTITPSSATSTAGGTTQFLVTGGVPPYSWSTTTPSLGDITSTGGSQNQNAVYTVGGPGSVGENTVIVTDHDGNVVTATVTSQ